MSNLQQLEEQIVSLSLVDAFELVNRLEKRLGVSATSTVVTRTETPLPIIAAEEQTEFSVVLEDMGATKINVIKAVREVTSLGLKEAKDLVDLVSSAPTVIKEGISKEQAESIKTKLTSAGAKVEIK
jgi:large subunit ribosomal protein L7/L12